MGLLERVAAVHRGRGQRARKSWSEPNFWDLDRLRWPFLSSSSLRSEREQLEHDFEGYVGRIYKRSGPIAALVFVRMAVFSEARLLFRRIRGGRPGDLFGTQELAIFERPWPGGTTQSLLARMLLDVDLAGNAYIARVGDRLRRLRPDWVTIVSGSREEPDLYGRALDAEVIGYYYHPPGSGREWFLLPDQVAHWAPIPDPVAEWRGMSWLTPVLRDIGADLAATRHKLSFFENAATPRLAVKLDASVTPEMFQRFKALMDEQHRGVDKAYSTLYLGGGADVTPLSFSLRDLDYKSVQALGEARLAAAAGVPAAIVGFSEGLQGSSLNAGNYGQARRRFADGTLRPLWRSAVGALSAIINVPGDAELWYDDRGVAFLREDARDAAQIFEIRARTIAQLVREGFTAESAIAATLAEDERLLVHTGLLSVQLQPPTTTVPEPAAGEAEAEEQQ